MLGVFESFGATSISGFSGFFIQDFQIRIPIPRISGLLGFFESDSPGSGLGFGIRDPEKIPTRSQIC